MDGRFGGLYCENIMENENQAAALKEGFEFKCSEGGISSCPWQITGENVDLLIFQIEIHAQNCHNLVIDEPGKEKILKLITRR
jgi:predicted small metal-binding protein